MDLFWVSGHKVLKDSSAGEKALKQHKALCSAKTVLNVKDVPLLYLFSYLKNTNLSSSFNSWSFFDTNILGQTNVLRLNLYK